MILTHSLKICLAVAPCDMRKSFDGLAAVVRNHLGEDPSSRTLYVFSNRKRDLIKLLYWDGNGFWVLAKRLEKGTFSWPSSLERGADKLRLKPEALEMLLSGIDLRDGMQRCWYEPKG